MTPSDCPDCGPPVVRPTAQTIGDTKYDRLAYSINTIPSRFVAARTKLQACLASGDLASIHIYTVGLIDMAKTMEYSDELTEKLDEIRKVMET